MTTLSTALDTIMCIMWALTYTFVLIGTIKYRYPLISPISQSVIISFEFAVLYSAIINNSLSFAYYSLAYIYWFLIELVIIGIVIYIGYIEKKDVAPYLVFTIILTCIMCYAVAYKHNTYFFSYYNTFIGEIIWFFHVLKKEYPLKPFALMAFLSKLIADSVAIFVYFGKGPLLIDTICVLLPLIDLSFVIVYFIKKSKESN